MWGHTVHMLPSDLKSCEVRVLSVNSDNGPIKTSSDLERGKWGALLMD